MSGEVGELQSSLEDLQKSKANSDKRLRSVEEQLNEATSKVAEYETTIAALQSAQSKATSENNELSTQLAEAESTVGTLMKAKSALESQVEDLQSELQSETSVSITVESAKLDCPLCVVVLTYLTPLAVQIFTVDSVLHTCSLSSLLH